MQAFLVDTPEGAVNFVGNSTECALLMLMRSWNEDYEKVRKDNEKNVVKVSREPAGTSWVLALQQPAYCCSDLRR